MAKTILFHQEASDKLLKGFDICANAVKSTLGPKGKNAIIQKPYQNLITNDGVSIAASIELSDPTEDMGAGIVRNASGQTNDDAGDGTTTTAVLLQSIVHEAMKRPENPMEIRESLMEAGNEAMGLLRAKSRTVGQQDLEAVAAISSEDKEIAGLIIDLVKKLGENAVINIEDSKSFSCSSEVVAGYDASVGFISPYFITDQATGKAEFSDVHVLVSEKKLSTLVDLKPIAEIFQKNNIGQCVFVVDDIDPSMTGLLVKNKIQGVFNSVVIVAHGEVLEDIAGATGAVLLGDRNGVSWQNVALTDLGKCQKATLSSNKSVFIGNNVSGVLRANELDGMAASEENQYRKEKLKDRAAKLRGGVGVLRIGASSDYTRDYLKLKAEDAVKSVQSAKEEGIVDGGGMAFYEISQELKGKGVGYDILRKALQSPLRTIIENSGKDYAEIMRKMPKKHGWDAKNGGYTDFGTAGIVDPAKVERCALQNALSAASIFITSFVSIADIPTK